MSTSINGSKATGWPAARGGPLSAADLTRRGYARLAERIDVARSRHKPLSLLRQEAKRLLEQMLDAEGSHLGKADRERVIEDATAGTLGFGPLEELFRDETQLEILALAWNQVIARTGEQWKPTSARFRDAAQYAEFVLRLAEVGTPNGGGPEAGGAFDVLLPNGFRAFAILPPGVLGQPPLVLLARGEPPQPPSKSSTPPPAASKSAVVPSPMARASTGSAVVPSPIARSVPAEPPRSTVPPPPPPTAPDPFSRLRTRATERLIARCAAAGVYDITQIPTPELTRILAVHVSETCTAERVKLDEAEQERLVLQILVAMGR